MDLPRVQSEISRARTSNRFIHRTGHSIARWCRASTWREEMAARSEIDVFIIPAGEVTVAGESQDRLITLGA